ncbi:uncharacterized protein [Prorops nasuta]|uniref:uncharacterized protein n=1 Tax=Prorops nasuta TaxID=863751 RepID=UPI0034CE7FF1
MNFCLFCKSLKLKIVRHYLQVHKNEEEVKKFAVLPKQCKERREIIKTLRLRGNFEYNTDNIHNKGDLLVSRRPNFKYPKKGIDYLCCVQCKGFFSKRTYYLHTNKCLKQNCSSNRTVKILGRTIVGRIHEYASETLKKIVFPVLREDDIVRLIRYDELLILYGNKLCLKYKLQQEHLMIRNRLRTLGRFLKILKEINPTVTDFASIFNPLFYDDCIKAVYKIARYDEETQMFKSSYTAFQIGTLLKQVGEFLRSQCIKKQDHAKKALVEDFLLLRNEDYASSVNKTVQETQNHRRREKNPVLPTMNDIKIFNQFLDKTRNEAYCVLETSFSTSMWLTVAETALLSIQTFNRRRAGEIERIAITDFENRKNHSQLTNKETCNQLSKKPEEIKNKYLRFEIRGKKGRTVPVLLDNELEKSVLLLLKYRKQMGIHIKNPYLFALPGFYKNRHKHLHSTDLMRQYADKCGAKYPHLLRGTLLRKHMATNCMKYNLNENDLSALTNFMGHEKSIHKEYYRLTQKEIDITQVSQYLEAAQGNINDESDLNDNSNYSDIEHSDENNNTLQKSGQKSRQVTKRSRWTVKEKDCVLNAFSAYLRKDNCPPVEEIKTLIKANPCLHSRTASQVKSWFNNQQKHARNK